jgi:hypothetical protein
MSQSRDEFHIFYIADISHLKLTIFSEQKLCVSVTCYLYTAMAQAKTIFETKSWGDIPLLYHDPCKH